LYHKGIGKPNMKLLINYVHIFFMKGKFASIKVTEVHCIFTLQFTSISKSNHDCMKICGGVGTHIIKREQRSLFKVKRL